MRYFADSRKAIVNYYRKYVLINRLEGLSLHRKTVSTLNDRLDMTQIEKTKTQEQYES